MSGKSESNTVSPQAKSVQLATLRLVIVGFALLVMSGKSAAVGGQVEIVTDVTAATRPGDLVLTPCLIYLPGDEREYSGECGSVLVPENYNNPQSRLIRLPVRRIKSSRASSLAPIFWFEGGPGSPNSLQYPTDGLIDGHDFVMVGYRGIEGEVDLQCPEIDDALRSVDSEHLGDNALAVYAQAAAACAGRLRDAGVDLDGYSMNQTIRDNEVVRTAMGYALINLFGNSYGTRLQMLYQWAHPERIQRSVMVAVNPPGHFVFDPEAIEDLLRRYSGLCASDTYCSSRTSDLFQTMRELSQQMPQQWMGIAIDAEMVNLITNISLHESIRQPGEPPLFGPAALDMWLDAAEGDASGMALVSLLAPLMLPGSFEWGHLLAMGGSAADYNDPQRDYAAQLRADTTIGSPLALLLWGLARGWPNSSDQSAALVQNSATETLLISGTLDGSTPMQFARDELLPHLARGQQVVIPELGHTETFWRSQPRARARLLNTYFDTGQVDASLYQYQAPEFRVEWGWSSLAKAAVWVVFVVAVLGLLVLLWVGRKLSRANASHDSVEPEV